jgi:hypothetical protein
VTRWGRACRTLAITAAIAIGAGFVAPSAARAAVAGAANLVNGSAAGNNIGVVHVQHAAPFAMSNYDALLPPNANTQDLLGWPHTAGIWVAATGR